MSPAPRTLVEMARALARERPERLAYLHLEEGDTEGGRLTFATHDAEARRVAAALLAVARPGDRALLVYEAGTDFLSAFFGCLYAGIIAVPVPAPEANRRQQGLPRLESVVTDCAPALTLVNGYTEKLLRDLGAAEGLLAASTWVNTATARAAEGAAAELPEVGPATIAYLQYTSGSTTAPRGVMLSHANLVGHLDMIRRACGYDAESVSVTWMPHFHDYGLIQGMLVPFSNGSPTIIMSPLDFVKHPVRLLRAITTYRGTHTEGPSFSYAHCVRRGGAESWRGLDLRSWRSVGNAAEPVHPDTLEKFSEVFAAYGFGATSMSPAYGLAEVTLLATSTPPDEAARVGHFDPAALLEDRVVPVPAGTPGARRLAACGYPLPETAVAIVRPDSRRRAAPDGVGEIWVSAPTIPGGYWNRPAESEEVFRARIAGEEQGATWLRTGDLGFQHEGRLYITSRLKDLIIVRGQNHHPQDIEWTVHEAHPLLRPGNCAAFGVEVADEEKLVLVAELQPGDHAPDALAAAAQAMADALALRHEIPLHAIVLIETGTMQKTSSGKVQRRAMKKAWLEGALAARHTWTPRAARAAGRGADGADGAVAKGAAGTASAAAPAAAGAGVAASGAMLDAAASRRRADELIAWLRHYAETRIDARLIDERRCVPPHIVMDFGNRGLLGLEAPPARGGQGLTHTDAWRVLEQLGAVDLTLATLVFLHNTNGLVPLLRYAPPALRDEFLPMLAAGRELAAFALSEPGAGSHLGAVEMRATPDGPDAWRLNGVKRWNAAAWAGVVTVFARLVGPDGRAGALTAFLMRTSEPGVRIGQESLTMGMRGIMQNALHFDNARVTRARILGEPGRGMTIATEVLTAGRLSMSAMCLGGVARCLQLALRYAERREIETGLLAENPQTLLPLGELAHRHAVERELLARCAARLEAGGRVEPEIAMALKVLTTDTLNAAADRLMQVLGGRGYMENNLAPQLLRDARMMSIGEGANESLLAALGRSVRLKRVVHDFLREAFPGDDAADRLATLAAAPGAAADAPGVALPAGARQAWRDALLGRAAGALLESAAARALAAREVAHAGTRAWAEARLAEVAREMERGTPALAAALPLDALRARVAGLAADIGDLEDRTPGVDEELDPLLRRAQAREETMTPPPAPPAAADLATLSVAEKRALLRRMLESGKE